MHLKYKIIVHSGVSQHAILFLVHNPASSVSFRSMGGGGGDFPSTELPMKF